MDIRKIRDFRKTLREFERLTNIQLRNCCTGVSFAQCHVLLEIEEKGQTTTGELAQNLNLDKSTLSRTIDGLVNIGQAKRLPHPSDRRYILIALTEQGKATCDAINRASDDYYNRVLERIPEEELETVIENFSQLVQAFLDYENQCSAEAACCNSVNDNKRGNYQ